MATMISKINASQVTAIYNITINYWTKVMAFGKNGLPCDLHVKD